MAKLLRRGILLLTMLAPACGGGDAQVDVTNPPDNMNPGPITMPIPQVELSALELDLAAIDLALGENTSLSVEGRYSDGTTRDLTVEATWASSDEAVARFTAPGQLETVGAGATTITVTYEEQSVSDRLVVAAPRPIALALDPAEAVIGIDTNVGGGIRITAMATFSDDSTADVTDQVEWTSSNRSIGFMSATETGRLALFGPVGELTITARLGDVETTGTYVVTGPVIEQIRITTRDNLRLVIGDPAVALEVQGRYTDGATQDLSAEVTWSSADPLIAVVTDNMVSPIGAGETTLTALYSYELAGVTTELTATMNVRVVDPIAPCPYPTNYSETLTYDATVAPYQWLNAFDEAGNNVDLYMEQMHCDPNISSIAFVVGAGWCPFCPEFKAYIDGLHAELEELGMKVVYVEIQTDSRVAATHQQANDIVNRAMRAGESTRIGAAAEGNVQPFNRAPSLPNLVIVRTSDMKVISLGRRQAPNTPGIDEIAAVPNRLWGNNW